MREFSRARGAPTHSCRISNGGDNAEQELKRTENEMRCEGVCSSGSQMVLHSCDSAKCVCMYVIHSWDCDKPMIHSWDPEKRRERLGGENSVAVLSCRTGGADGEFTVDTKAITHSGGVPITEIKIGVTDE